MIENMMKAAERIENKLAEMEEGIQPAKSKITNPAKTNFLEALRTGLENARNDNYTKEKILEQVVELETCLRDVFKCPELIVQIASVYKKEPGIERAQVQSFFKDHVKVMTLHARLHDSIWVFCEVKSTTVATYLPLKLSSPFGNTTAETVEDFQEYIKMILARPETVRSLQKMIED